MNIAILTNEYPPHVYGGAGVHVEYLTRALARLDDDAHQVTVSSAIRTSSTLAGAPSPRKH